MTKVPEQLADVIHAANKRIIVAENELGAAKAAYALAWNDVTKYCRANGDTVSPAELIMRVENAALGMAESASGKWYWKEPKVRS